MPYKESCEKFIKKLLHTRFPKLHIKLGLTHCSESELNYIACCDTTTYHSELLILTMVEEGTNINRRTKGLEMYRRQRVRSESENIIFFFHQKLPSIQFHYYTD